VRERLLAIKDRALKYGGVVGYPLFYVVCLMLFASVTFPYDKLKERIVASFNVQPRPGSSPQELQIDDMGGYWVSGIRMKGIRLLTASGEPGKPPSKIEIDEATVRYSLLPMLVGSSDMNFDLIAFGGEVSGSYDTQDKDKSVDVSIESIDIGKIPPIVQVLGVPLEGKLGGTIRLVMLEGKASRATGAVSLEAKDVSVGDGKAKFKGTIALPKIEVGAITLAADAKDGVLKITKLAAGGRDVDVQGEGRIAMRELVTDSLCDSQLRFKINDAYRAKSDVTKSLFGAPGSNGPGLFELADAKIRSSKRPDGYYGWSVRGTLGNPDFIPAGNASVGFGPSK
jgi:type II secretion system protein N